MSKTLSNCARISISKVRFHNRELSYIITYISNEFHYIASHVTIIEMDHLKVLVVRHYINYLPFVENWEKVG
jgi:hypothetical protein